MTNESGCIEGELLRHTQDQLREIAADILRQAKALGATDAATEVAERDGRSVSVRQGKTETIGFSRDDSVSVTVYIGKRKGQAAAGDFSASAIRETVEAAIDIARFTANDETAGLADADLLEQSPRDLDLYHPYDLTPAEAAEIACRAEQAAFAASSDVAGSDGASVRSIHSQFVLASSNGFIGGYPVSTHAINCAVIAGKGERMQRGGWSAQRTRRDDLDTAESVGRCAGLRASARLDARRIKTCKVPVLYEAPQALGLLAAFANAVGGAALYRRESFLADSLGKTVFADHIRIDEDPHLPRESGSAPFDREGVRTLRRAIVEDGAVCGYFLTTYPARKLGMRSTGSAGGPYNLSLRSARTSSTDDFDTMLGMLGTGVLVTETMGQGINPMTGDYSLGAAGFWVEDGVIQYPVEEFTVAGNLNEMFRTTVAVGADQYVRGNLRSGSVLIEEMTIAGV